MPHTHQLPLRFWEAMVSRDAAGVQTALKVSDHDGFPRVGLGHKKSPPPPITPEEQVGRTRTSPAVTPRKVSRPKVHHLEDLARPEKRPATEAESRSQDFFGFVKESESQDFFIFFEESKSWEFCVFFEESLPKGQTESVPRFGAPQDQLVSVFLISET